MPFRLLTWKIGTSKDFKDRFSPCGYQYNIKRNTLGFQGCGDAKSLYRLNCPLGIESPYDILSGFGTNPFCTSTIPDTLPFSLSIDFLPIRSMKVLVEYNCWHNNNPV